MEYGMSKKQIKSKPSTKKEWPAAVYLWAFGLGLIGYLIVGEMILESKPHPIHWLSGLIGGILGIGVGWLWYRWRGDIF